MIFTFQDCCRPLNRYYSVVLALKALVGDRLTMTEKISCMQVLADVFCIKI